MDGSNDVEHAGEFSWESQGDLFRGGDGHVIERMLWYYQVPSCIVYPICRWHVRVDGTLMQTQLHGKLHSMLIMKTALSLLNKKDHMTCFWPVFSLQRTSPVLSDVAMLCGRLAHLMGFTIKASNGWKSAGAEHLWCPRVKVAHKPKLLEC